VFAEAEYDVDVVVLFFVCAGKIRESGTKQRQPFLVGENTSIYQLGIKTQINSQLADVLRL